MLKATVYGDTNVGLVRSNNEDAYIAQAIWGDHYWLLVVIDGLGGYEGGEVASSIAKSTILHTVESGRGKDCLDVIVQAVTDANNEIYKQRNSRDDLREMGCVITAAILDLERRQMSMAHVGDTRMYQYDDNGLIKVTHDHSFVGMLEEEGHITEKQAMIHPKRNVIDRIVGDRIKDIEEPDFIETAIFPIEKGQQFLLCSDGLSDMIGSEEIASVLRVRNNSKKKVRKLISLANINGGQDNITVIVASIEIDGSASRIVRRTNTSVRQKKEKIQICKGGKNKNKGTFVIDTADKYQNKKSKNFTSLVIVTVIFMALLIIIVLLLIR